MKFASILVATIVLVCSQIAHVQANAFSEALGNLFVGAMSATQANMTNTNTTCYTNAVTVQDEIKLMFDSFNPSIFFDRFQIAQIKLQATLKACSLDIMINSLDSRMSNLDYTLGIISNVISQTAGGLQTQDFYLKSNTSPSPIYITLNSVYPFI